MHGQGLAANPRRRHRRRYNRRYSGNPSIMDLAVNPPYSGLFENPAGPLSVSNLKAFAVASAGLAFGLATARFADRWVATMKPADSKGGLKSNRPWFGRAAVAAINRRPTILRLGVQAGGAVLGIAGAYALRNRGLAPWLLGGIALGFGSNLFLQFIEWWAIPWLLKVKDPSEQTLANRTYALEQLDAQDRVDAAFEDWQGIPALAANQDQNAPQISSPVTIPASIATLGRPGAFAMMGAPRKFIPDGRVGNCDICGGNGGHYSGCQNCDTCNGGGGRKCAYTVQPGVDIYAVSQQSGVSVNEIAAMNGGGGPESFWTVGREVTMPEAACNVVLKMTPSLPQQPTIPVTTTVPNQPVIPTAVALPQQPPSYSGQTYQAMGPIIPGQQLRAPVIAGTPQQKAGGNSFASVSYATVGGHE